MNDNSKLIILALLVEIILFALMKFRYISEEILGFIVFITFIIIPIALYFISSGLLIDLNLSRSFKTSKARIWERLLASLPFALYIVICVFFGAMVITVAIQKGDFKAEPLQIIGVIIMGIIFIKISFSLLKKLIGPTFVTGKIISFRSDEVAQAFIDKGELYNFHEYLESSLKAANYNVKPDLDEHGYFLNIVINKISHHVHFLIQNQEYSPYFDDIEDDCELQPQDYTFAIQVESNIGIFKRAKNVLAEQQHKELNVVITSILQQNTSIEIVYDQ